MVKHLSPTPVFTGLIREVRAWQKWLAPLDSIPVKDGVTGLSLRGSSHFFAYCRRKDVPLNYARNVRPELCMDPNDVVVLEKEYMSSNDLRQPVFRFCHVGASWRLPTAPEEWHPRSKFTPEFVSGLNTLVELVRAHYPDKENAVMYLQSWLDAPRCPTHHPPNPKILTYQLQSGNAISVPIGTAIVAAVVEQSGYHKAMNVRRIGGAKAGWQAAADMIKEVPLHVWISFKQSLGVSAHQATMEWHGARTAGNARSSNSGARC